MRKIMLALALMLTVIAPIFALDGLYLSEGDSSSVSIYTAYGQVEDPLASITADACIIHTGESTAVFGSPFGTITLEPETLAYVQGLAGGDAAIYLLDGQIHLNATTTRPMVVFTSSASYSFAGSGEYIFVYTSLLDVAVNNSQNTVSVYDALRRQSSVLRPYHYSDLIGRRLDAPIVNQTSERVDEHHIVSGSYNFRGIVFSYSFSTDGSGNVSYPAGMIGQSDVDVFMASYMAQTTIPQLKDGVYYSWDADGSVSFIYPDVYSEEDLRYVIHDFLVYLDHYLEASFIPAAPSFSSVTTRVQGPVPEAPSFSAVTTEVLRTPPQESSFDSVTTTVERGETTTLTIGFSLSAVVGEKTPAVPEAPFIVEPWVTVEDR